MSKAEKNKSILYNYREGFILYSPLPRVQITVINWVITNPELTLTHVNFHVVSWVIYISNCTVKKVQPNYNAAKPCC